MKSLSISLLSLALLTLTGCNSSPPTPVAANLHQAAVFYPDQIPKLVAKGAAIDKLDADGNSPLWVAVRFSRLESVQKLLAAGADPNLRGQSGWTSLHCVTFCGRNAADVQIAELLIRHGADVNATEPRYGETPLHYAVRATESPALTRLLLSAGAKVDAQSDPRQDTALQFAVSHRNPELVELLLSAGASPDIKNNVGFVPLQQAPENKAIASLFEKYAD